MIFHENDCYHLYNRTNNQEALFRSEDNYIYFLKKYRYYLDEYIDTVCYCLMPTHFHFLIRIKKSRPEDDLSIINRKIGNLLNSYAQAYNKMWERNGNLFNQKTKAKLIDNDKYLITLLTYIHQNPIRSNLVVKAEEWKFSSYQDYIDIRKGTLPSKDLILSRIKQKELKELTEHSMLTNPELTYKVESGNKPSEGFKPSEGSRFNMDDINKIRGYANG